MRMLRTFEAGNAFPRVLKLSRRDVVIVTNRGKPVAATAVAFMTALLEMYAVTFVLSGVNQAAYSVSGGNMLLDFAWDPEERATSVGPSPRRTTVLVATSVSGRRSP